VDVKAAVTDSAWVMVTWQVPVPEHPPPLQPSNVELDGMAVSVTTVPWSYASVQSPPQLMPAGLLVTVPLPVPDFETVNSHTLMKVAVTDRAWSMVTWQVPVPEHPPPLQPSNREPAAGVAVSMTTVPWP
jgi:hypothetical protein